MSTSTNPPISTIGPSKVITSTQLWASHPSHRLLHLKMREKKKKKILAPVSLYIITYAFCCKVCIYTVEWVYNIGWYGLVYIWNRLVFFSVSPFFFLFGCIYFLFFFFLERTKRSSCYCFLPRQTCKRKEAEVKNRYKKEVEFKTGEKCFSEKCLNQPLLFTHKKKEAFKYLQSSCI